MFDKIVVAIDESDHAKSVIAAAADLAAKFGSEVRVLHVLEIGFVGKAGTVNLEDSEETHKLVNDAVAAFEAKDVRASGNVRAALHGRVAAQINDEAQHFGANAIVTGTRGLGDFEGILLGSTTHKLLHLTNLPVLVIP